MDGSVAKDIPMVVNPRYLLSLDFIEKGFVGIASTRVCISPREPASLCVRTFFC